MRDIVEDLRTAAETDKNPWDVDVYERAATEIIKLRKQVTALSSAAGEFGEGLV